MLQPQKQCLQFNLANMRLFLTHQTYYQFLEKVEKKSGEIANLIRKPFSTLDKKKKRTGWKEILIF